MFLSMLVAWMIPDVPRSLREQLKKENMMLMEFLLNQDQEAQAKSHSQRGANPCFPASIDIIVEAPAKEQEEDAPGEVEVLLNAVSSSRDSDPEVGGSDHQTVEEQGGKESDDTAAADLQEKGTDAEDMTEGGEGICVHKNDEEKGEKGEIKELKPAEDFTVDLDCFMSELGLLGERRKFDDAYFCTFYQICILTVEPISCPLDEESSCASAVPGLSDSKQKPHKDQKPPSGSSSQSLKSFTTNITPSDADASRYSLIAPPPRQHGPKLKARCSTLPSRPRGSEACYSLPRPSHSSSLSKFQQTLAPLVPLESSSSTNSHPDSPPPASVSPSSLQPAPSQSATQPKATGELCVLKGPPPQQPRSRANARCSTLPPRQRPRAPEEASPKPSHSASLTTLEERTPPSPSELKQNTPV